MEGEHSSEFSMGNTPQERGSSHIPDRYILPSSHRPSQNPETVDIPVIDVARLRHCPNDRSLVIKDIGTACRKLGFFQIVNYGLSDAVMNNALTSASEFFNLPTEEKTEFMCNDVKKPVRYGTSLKDRVDKVQFWRVFLKHYAHPLQDWIGSWPQNPPKHRNDGKVLREKVRKVAMEVMGAITESLGLGTSYVSTEMEEGMQVMAVNCYSPCPYPDRVLGLPPHSDYTCITILLQSYPGLEVLDAEDGTWKLVPKVQGALQVHVGDHLEVLSNGLYKSVVHRATLNSEQTRFSLASLHSLGMDVKMETARELVDEQHPKGYKESSFNDFLTFLTNNDITDGRNFIDTLKIKA